MKKKFDKDKGYCCHFIKDIIDSNASTACYAALLPLKYIAKYRTFFLQDCSPSFHKQESGCIPGFRVIFCPQCGVKFPRPLNAQWKKILKYEFHINPDNEEYIKTVPSEFLSDIWWKKRNF